MTNSMCRNVACPGHWNWAVPASAAPVLRDEQAALARRMEELARAHPRFGYRRIWAQLDREGWTVNKKAVRRLYREPGLTPYSHHDDRNAPYLRAGSARERFAGMRLGRPRDQFLNPGTSPCYPVSAKIISAHGGREMRARVGQPTPQSSRSRATMPQHQCPESCDHTPGGPCRGFGHRLELDRTRHRVERDTVAIGRQRGAVG